MSPNDSIANPTLCEADDETFWPWQCWPDIANWSHKEATVVLVPIAGFADWGLGEALDVEEKVLMAVIREACRLRTPDQRLLVLPPLRYTLGPEPGCAFSVDPDTACLLLEEVVGSVALSGFTKVVFVNASPWMEELCKAVGRDLRISLKLQMFCVQLSALGLDFNPRRGGDRAKLKEALAGIRAHAADPASGPLGGAVGEVAGRLVALLAEMRDRPALANGGALETRTWP